MKNIIHSELWINTEYFIEAFRCACALSYLEEHNEICQFINTKDFIDSKLHRFYINVCALVDIHCEYFVSNSKRASYKKMLKTMCPSYDWIFYERDKNAAHKDSDYLVETDVSLSELIIRMKQALNVTKIICANIISDKIEYEYYSYDSLLFRYVNGITPGLEKELNSNIYKNYQINNKNLALFEAISDSRQVRNLKQPNTNYCVVCTNGLMGQPYDMLEHRQNMCFILNAYYGCDMWVTLQNKYINEVLDTFFNILNCF